MYRVNKLKRNVLAVPDEVLFHLPSDGTVDIRQILNNIIIAEERFIAPALGNDFYIDLINKKNVEVTALNQASLLVQINNSLTAEGKAPIAITDIPIGTVVNAIELITDPKEKELWNMYLWKLCAECVDYMATVPTWLRHTAQGQQKNNPGVIGGSGQGSVTGDIKDVKFKVDVILQERIDPLIERMKLYLCNNISFFPLYSDPNCSNCKEAPDGISWKRKSGVIFGAYDCDKSCCDD